eukprot:scaffold8165_cov116-Isochrysis_galbana.AAC.7
MGGGEELRGNYMGNQNLTAQDIRGQDHILHILHPQHCQPRHDLQVTLPPTKRRKALGIHRK